MPSLVRQSPVPLFWFLLASICHALFWRVVKPLVPKRDGVACRLRSREWGSGRVGINRTVFYHSDFRHVRRSFLPWTVKSKSNSYKKTNVLLGTETVTGPEHRTSTRVEETNRFVRATVALRRNNALDGINVLGFGSTEFFLVNWVGSRGAMCMQVPSLIQSLTTTWFDQWLKEKGCFKQILTSLSLSLAVAGR